jgi:hypothetical protein
MMTSDYEVRIEKEGDMNYFSIFSVLSWGERENVQDSRKCLCK